MEPVFSTRDERSAVSDGKAGSRGATHAGKCSTLKLGIVKLKRKVNHAPAYFIQFRSFRKKFQVTHALPDADAERVSVCDA